MWREGEQVWILCQGCSRHLRITHLPSGTVVCPDCHERHDYNLTGQFECRAKTLPDYLKDSHETAMALIELLAATEEMQAHEIETFMRLVSRAVIAGAAQHKP